MTTLAQEFAYDRGSPEKGPSIRANAKQITYSLPPYRQDQQSTAYPSPGRGVSGESTN